MIEIGQNGRNWPKIAKIVDSGQKWLESAKNGQNWQKGLIMAKVGQKFLKLAKNVSSVRFPCYPHNPWFLGMK